MESKIFYKIFEELNKADCPDTSSWLLWQPLHMSTSSSARFASPLAPLWLDILLPKIKALLVHSTSKNFSKFFVLRYMHRALNIDQNKN